MPKTLLFDFEMLESTMKKRPRGSFLGMRTKNSYVHSLSLRDWNQHRDVSEINE